jgi:acyl-CoA thioester hydrolase
MPRTRLVQQKTYEFRSSVSVQPRDVNYGGHLGNDALIALVGTARALVFRALALSELDLGDGRTGMVMTDLTVNYKAEGYLFDELLIETHVGELTRTGFRFFHRVTKGGKLVALVDTGFVAFDYASKRIVPVPQAFVKAVADRMAQGAP